MSGAIDLTFIQRVAGEKVYLRGFQYYIDGCVEPINLQGCADKQAQFTVKGSADYRVDLVQQHSGSLLGECDCPHARDGNFCKHQVAAALFWKARLGEAQELVDAMAQASLARLTRPDSPPQVKEVSAATRKRRATLQLKQEQLRAFVQAQSQEALTERLWQWAIQDKALMAELTLWQTHEQANTGGYSWASLKDTIQNLLPAASNLWGRSLAHYERQAEPLMPLLEAVLQADPETARKGCEFALKRFFKVMESSDNSQGEMAQLYHFLIECLNRALQACPPDATWLKTWLKLREADAWDQWDIAATYQAAGPQVQQAFNKLAIQQWQQWAQKNAAKLLCQSDQSNLVGNATPIAAGLGKAPAPISTRFDYASQQLRESYLLAIDSAGDVLSSIRQRYTSARNASDVLELAQWCQAHHKQREALDYARQAYKLDPAHRGVESFLLQCYERDGWDEEAYAIRYEQFQQRPQELSVRRNLLQAGQRIGKSAQCLQQDLNAWAEQREAANQQAQQARLARNRHQQAGCQAVAGRDVSLRATWYLQDGESEKAFDLVVQDESHCCDMACRLAIAMALPPERHRDAVQWLTSILQAQLQQANSPYQKELRLVGDILSRLPEAERSEWLQSLATQYSLKRNFVKGLLMV